MQYRIVAGAGIDRMEQLKGKVIGVARLHDVAHFYLRLALKRFGMTDQDIQMAAVGGQSDRVRAQQLPWRRAGEQSRPLLPDRVDPR